MTFDLWNTLLSEGNYRGLRIKYLTDTLREHNILRNYDEINEAYILTHDYVHKVWERENYRYVLAEERVNHILRKLNVELPRDIKAMVIKEFEETILRDPPPLIEGVREALETLHIRYKMGIICDTGITPGYVLRKVLKRNQILDLFTSIVFSDEVGFNKPHRLMFETALRELKANPSEAVHVGDLLETDIAGAKKIGMKAVLISRTEEQRSYLNIRPDLEISNLQELIGHLEGLI